MQTGLAGAEGVMSPGDTISPIARLGLRAVRNLGAGAQNFQHIRGSDFRAARIDSSAGRLEKYFTSLFSVVGKSAYMERGRPRGCGRSTPDGK